MIPRSCKAAVFRGAEKQIHIEELPIPTLAGSEALVRVECCTICGSDLHTITGKRKEQTPSILGHEAIGTVQQLADQPPRDVSGAPIRIGDRITWSVAAACGKCDRCVRGYPQKCRELAKYGHELAVGRYALSGGLAEFLVLRPGSAIVKLRPSQPKEVICPVNCATATIAAALRVAGELSEQRVLILGAGMLGLTASAMAKTRRAKSITVVDRLSERLERASAFGATRSIQWDANDKRLDTGLPGVQGGECFDVILELSGAPEACEAAVSLGDIGARVVLVGSVMPSAPMSITPERVVRNWLSIHGVHNYAPGDLQAAVTFLEESRDEFPFGHLVERSFSLDNVSEAVRYSIDEKPVRVAVCP